MVFTNPFNGILAQSYKIMLLGKSLGCRGCANQLRKEANKNKSTTQGTIITRRQIFSHVILTFRVSAQSAMTASNVFWPGC